MKWWKQWACKVNKTKVHKIKYFSSVTEEFKKMLFYRWGWDPSFNKDHNEGFPRRGKKKRREKSQTCEQDRIWLARPALFVCMCKDVSAWNRSIHSWCGSQQSTALPTVVIFWQPDYSWGGIFTVVKWGFNGQLSSDKYISAEEREPR